MDNLIRSLPEDLKTKKNDLDEFYQLAKRVIEYMSSVITDTKTTENNYFLFTSEISNSKKYVRPINKNLFIMKISDFEKKYAELKEIFESLKAGDRDFEKSHYECIDQITYTIQQAIGVGLDLLIESNSAKKHVGNRFEELIRAIVTELGVSCKKIVLSIPYDIEVNKQKNYKCETDMVFSQHKTIKSSSKDIDFSEVVVSLKTTSKDRLGKIFIDKILLENFVGHEVKVIGIFHNDIQRKALDSTGGTLVSGLFMVYSKFLTKLDGIYYIDLPKNAEKAPLNQYIKKFSNFIIDDIWELMK